MEGKGKKAWKGGKAVPIENSNPVSILTCIETWDQEAVGFLRGLMLGGDSWRIFRSVPFLGVRCGWSRSMASGPAGTFRAQQTLIGNLQCKNQGRDHKLSKTLELSVTVLESCQALPLSPGWAGTLSLPPKKARVLERPGPSSHFFTWTAIRKAGQNLRFRVFKLENVLSVWCSYCFLQLARVTWQS